jgi:hypothetical protein
MRHGGVVEEHIDPAEGRDREINKSLAVRRRRQVAWMPGHHRSACGAHGLNGRFRRVDVQIAGGRRDLPSGTRRADHLARSCPSCPSARVSDPAAQRSALI